jgi:hypothetical protein
MRKGKPPLTRHQDHRGPTEPRTALQRRQQKLAMILECTNPISDVKRRKRLNQVLTELFWLHEGKLVIPGVSLFVPGGIVPVPQTDPFILALSMCSPSDDWRKILANEILLYLEKAFRNDHALAVPDAFDLCRTFGLDVPGWVRDAPPKVSRRGERSRKAQIDLFKTDCYRFILVEVEGSRIRAERRNPDHRHDEQKRDKFARAKAMLRDSWADTPNKGATEDTGAIEDSHNRFLRRRASYYVCPPFLMDMLKIQAPTVFEILS